MSQAFFAPPSTYAELLPTPPAAATHGASPAPVWVSAQTSTSITAMPIPRGALAWDPTPAREVPPDAAIRLPQEWPPIPANQSTARAPLGIGIAVIDVDVCADT